jgi:hypothetical protein
VKKMRERRTIASPPGSSLKNTFTYGTDTSAANTTVDPFLSLSLPLPSLPVPPRYYTAYNSMEPLDLIVSVEHCCNCEHHSMTLRHDPREYADYSDAALLVLARKLHGMYSLNKQRYLLRYNHLLFTAHHIYIVHY